MKEVTLMIGTFYNFCLLIIIVTDHNLRLRYLRGLTGIYKNDKF